MRRESARPEGCSATMTTTTATMISTVDLKVSLHKLYCRKEISYFSRKSFITSCVCLRAHTIEVCASMTHTHSLKYCILHRAKLNTPMAASILEWNPAHTPPRMWLYDAHRSTISRTALTACIAAAILNIYLRLECARTDLLFHIYFSPVLLSFCVLAIFRLFVRTDLIISCAQFFFSAITSVVWAKSWEWCTLYACICLFVCMWVRVKSSPAW